MIRPDRARPNHVPATEKDGAPMPLHEQDNPAAELFGPELSRTMSSALGGLPVQTELLVSGAVVRGRRTRRRRRAAAWGTAGTALGALTAFAVITALPGAGDGSSTAYGVRIPDFAPAAAQAAPPPGKEALTGAATSTVLRDLLPSHIGRYAAHWQDSDPRYRSVQTSAGLTFLPDKSSVGVRVMGGFAYPSRASDPGAGKVTGPPDSTPGKPGSDSKKDALRTDAGGPAKQLHITSSNELRQIYTCDAHASGQPHSACRLTTLEDGSVLLVRAGTSPAAPTRTADLLRPDGTRVMVTAIGGSLTDAQLRTIAASPRWQQWVAPAVNGKAAGKTP